MSEFGPAFDRAQTAYDARESELASEVLETAVPNFRKPSFNQGKVLQA